MYKNKLLIVFLLIALLLTGCNRVNEDPLYFNSLILESSSDISSEQPEPGMVRGDITNIFRKDGRILLSKDPFLLLYMNPEGLEGYLEVDGKIEHFYLIDLYTCETEWTVALTKEYKPHDTWAYEKNENVFMFCTLVHKTDYELVEVIDPETQGSSGEEFILKAANIPKRDVARKFKEFKNQSKQEILNYFEAH